MALLANKKKASERTGKEKQWMPSSFFIHFLWGFVLQWLPRHITGRDDVADTVPLDKPLSLFPMAARSSIVLQRWMGLKWLLFPTYTLPTPVGVGHQWTIPTNRGHF
jgi:hypothetical protein